MRILVHDFCGHGFQLQLSRWLAGEGHRVLHLYCTAIESPRGEAALRPDDPPGLTIAGLDIGAPIAKYSPLRRAWQEQRYGALAGRRLADFQPDVVLSGNCSPLVQHRLQASARRVGAGFVTWLQDVYAHAVARGLRRRAPVAAGLAAGPVRAVERAVLRRSDAVVAITETFRADLDAAGVPRARQTVIPNWAPLTTPPAPPAAAAWRGAHGLRGVFVYLYTGTLGLKHDPRHLLALARELACVPEAAVVVASQGPGRAYLERAKVREGLPNLLLLDFLPESELATARAAADVLLGLLEADAGRYSVPSKVLGCLAAGRPVLAAMPANNLAARGLRSSGAGIVVPPGQTADFVAAAERLRHDPALRAACGAAGRAHAERHFAIDAVGARFLRVLTAAARRGRDSVPLAPVAAMD